MGVRILPVSSLLLERFFRGETRPADSTSPADIHIEGVAFDFHTREVEFRCFSAEWDGPPEGDVVPRFIPILTQKESERS